MTYRNILLIDDDAEDHEIFKSALAHVSSERSCYTLTDAHEALPGLIDGTLAPDVIFLDLNMPIMSGQDFLREVKKTPQIAHIPVIIFSTSSNAETIRLTRELGAVDFITKPDRFDKLTEILKSIFCTQFES